MCYFITLGLPQDKAELLETHVPRGFHVAPITNASVLRQMGQGLRTYLLMSGGCSCDLFREPPSAGESERQARLHATQEKLRRKYDKMGWSTAKIDRALAQRPRQDRAEPFVGLRGDVQQFLGRLAGNVGQLAFLVHWYDEDVQEGRLVCKQGETVSPATLLETRLRLEVDEIVRVGDR